MVADLEQVDKNAKEMISPKLGTIPKNRRWTIKIFLEEIRF